LASLLGPIFYRLPEVIGNSLTNSSEGIDNFCQ
jgi:hypothetical protein